MTPEDQCWFLREYLVESVRTGSRTWELGETNQLVSNFKREIRHRGTPSWQHKLRAIDVFAQELAVQVSQHLLFAAMPSSKPVDDPEYDDRLVQVLAKARELNPKIHICTPVIRTQKIPPSHTRPGPRRPQDHLPSLAFNALPDVMPHQAVVLLDDVLTSGSTFKAVQHVIKAARPEVTVAGCFWARRKTVFTELSDPPP